MQVPPRPSGTSLRLRALSDAASCCPAKTRAPCPLGQRASQNAVPPLASPPPHESGLTGSTPKDPHAVSGAPGGAYWDLSSVGAAAPGCIPAAALSPFHRPGALLPGLSDATSSHHRVTWHYTGKERICQHCRAAFPGGGQDMFSPPPYNFFSPPSRYRGRTRSTPSASTSMFSADSTVSRPVRRREM